MSLSQAFRVSRSEQNTGLSVQMFCVWDNGNLGESPELGVSFLNFLDFEVRQVGAKMGGKRRTGWPDLGVHTDQLLGLL